MIFSYSRNLPNILAEYYSIYVMKYHERCHTYSFLCFILLFLFMFQNHISY